jgi:dolichyl-phosphate beta-glucosyltransferase
MRIHFVIPAYNESQRLPAYLESLLPAIEASELDITVQVIENGSTDEDVEQLQAAIQRLYNLYIHLLPLERLPNGRGKGRAVYHGWKMSPDADILGFVDADGSIAAPELIRLSHEAAARPHEALFGSRVTMLGKTIDRTPLRHVSGRLFASLVHFITGIPIHDSQCGIKLVPANWFYKVQNQMEEAGFLFDVELLFQLRQSGIAIREVPIDWHDTPGGHISLLRDSWSMSRGLLRLKKRFDP